MPMTAALEAIRGRIRAAAAGRPVALVAVSKQQSPEAIASLAAAGQRAFGENYAQEARAKQQALAQAALEWHFIGPLQSNKCREVARHFAWLQSLDREKLVPLLARERPVDAPPLQVLVQVDIDDEPTKSGCRPEQAAALCRRVASEPRLHLRGLMAIPRPDPDPARRRAAFARMRALFESLAPGHPNFDTLSMGMSEDFELAIAEGATMVRIGSALFGPRPSA